MPPLDHLHASFGRVLRKLRTQAGLSQEQLAEASDLTRNFVSELELGVKSPSLRTIAKVAKALDIHPHELIRAAEEQRL